MIDLICNMHKQYFFHYSANCQVFRGYDGLFRIAYTTPIVRSYTSLLHCSTDVIGRSRQTPSFIYRRFTSGVTIANGYCQDVQSDPFRRSFGQDTSLNVSRVSVEALKRVSASHRYTYMSVFTSVSGSVHDLPSEYSYAVGRTISLLIVHTKLIQRTNKLLHTYIFLTF